MAARLAQKSEPMSAHRPKQLIACLALAVVGSTALLLLTRKPDSVDAHEVSTLAAPDSSNAEVISGEIASREARESLGGATAPATDGDEPKPDSKSQPGPRKSWEGVRDEFRAMCASYDASNEQTMVEYAERWGIQAQGDVRGVPDFSSKYLNPEAKHLGELDIERLNLIVEDYSAALQFMGQEASELERIGIEQYFDLEMFIKYPTELNAPAPPMQTNGRWGRSSKVEYGGWTVYTRFSSSEFPELETQMEAISQLKAERQQAVKGYIEVL
jgi:hypothetical protein